MRNTIGGDFVKAAKIAVAVMVAAMLMFLATKPDYLDAT